MPFALVLCLIFLLTPSSPASAREKLTGKSREAFGRKAEEKPPEKGLGASFDHSAWDEFLKRFVNDAGEVDYSGVSRDPKLLNTYLRALDSLRDATIGDGSREELLAYWINAYHAGVIKLITDHYPVKSIQDIPGVWDIPVIRDGEDGYSLNTIRASQLVGGFRDEKIHTVLCSGARSSPKLRREAFTGPRAEGQLFLAAREFVNDSVRNQITPGSKTIKISRIFKWYGKDFNLDFGSSENDLGLSKEEFAVVSFLAHYSGDAAWIQYLEEGRYKIKYLPYDWSLNEWRSEEKSSALSASN